MLYQIAVGRDESGKRLDQVLSGALTQFSRAKLQKAIRGGFCAVDGMVVTSPDMKVRQNQIARLELEDKASELAAENGDLCVVWQDEHMAVCDKPPDLTVHPCPSCPGHTLVQRLLARFPQLARQEGQRPGIVHRLDKDTSGLIVVALTGEMRLLLAGAFADRLVQKEYLALVYGVPPENGEIAEPIGRHPSIKTRMAVMPRNRGGKPAHSQWRRLWHSANGKISLVAVRIFTGRTHQIRVHMAHLGYPILGDKLYAPSYVRNLAKRQMLHAWRLSLRHPLTHAQLKFRAMPPPDFFEAMRNGAARLRGVVVTGNPGCGKSTFCGQLEANGLPAISADKIVADLYAARSPVTDWLEMRHCGCVVNGAVDKAALLRILRDNSSMRQEFEEFVHALVFDRIAEFWQDAQDRGLMAAAAEIPLFFEGGLQKKFKLPVFVVGVRRDLEKRHKAVMLSRGWSLDKTMTLEKWQWPEARKMAACDMVIDNSETERELAEKAGELMAMLEELRLKDERELAAMLDALCH